MDDSTITKIIVPEPIQAKTPPPCESGENTFNLADIYTNNKEVMPNA